MCNFLPLKYRKDFGFDLSTILHIFDRMSIDCGRTWTRLARLTPVGLGNHGAP